MAGGEVSADSDSLQGNSTSLAAGIASALIPGLGQLYHRQISKGLGLMLLAVLSILLVFLGIGIVMVGIVWAYAIYDAYKPTEPVFVPDDAVFWQSLILVVLGGVLASTGFVFTFLLLGGAPPEWAPPLLVTGLTGIILGLGWYWKT